MSVSKEQCGRLAVALSYVKDAYASKHGERPSVKRLADVLNKAAGGSDLFKESQIYSLIQGKYAPNPAQEIAWTKAIEDVCKQEQLKIESVSNIPDEIIKQYGKVAPTALPVAHSDSLFKGDHIDEPGLFRGAWRLFYSSPVNRQSQPIPEIRGILAIFGDINPETNQISVQMVSGNTVWTGFAYVFEWHLYVVCTAKLKTETAFFILNKPTKSQPNFVAGIGSALERGLDHTVHPAMGVLCFGQKCHGEFAERAPNKKHPLPDAVRVSLEKLLAGQPLPEEDNEILRAEFKATYPTMEAWAADHEELADHLAKRVSVNSNAVAMQSLFFKWR